jgi:hypothetical protein
MKKIINDFLHFYLNAVIYLVLIQFFLIFFVISDAWKAIKIANKYNMSIKEFAKQCLYQGYYFFSNKIINDSDCYFFFGFQRKLNKIIFIDIIIPPVHEILLKDNQYSWHVRKDFNFLRIGNQSIQYPMDDLFRDEPSN